MANQPDSTDPDPNPTIFCALVWDKQTNGATLNSEDVYTNQAADARTNGALQRNMSFSKRFKVLDTWLFNYPPTMMATNDQATYTMAIAGNQVPFQLAHKFTKPLVVNFTTGSTTADVANVIDNSLHLIAYATNIGAAPQILYNSRMRFIG